MIFIQAVCFLESTLYVLQIIHILQALKKFEQSTQVRAPDVHIQEHTFRSARLPDMRMPSSACLQGARTGVCVHHRRAHPRALPSLRIRGAITQECAPPRHASLAPTCLGAHAPPSGMRSLGLHAPHRRAHAYARLCTPPRRPSTHMHPCACTHPRRWYISAHEHDACIRSTLRRALPSVTDGISSASNACCNTPLKIWKNLL